MPQKQVFLSLGSNLGERRQNIENALRNLEREGLQIVRRSSFYETEPQDLREQPWFLNIAVECRTTLFPLMLLSTTQRIERQLGRERHAKVPAKGPRLIDIDVILYAKVIIETPRLVVPHPRMLDRRFVLEPLVEISPELRHPATGRLLRDHLKEVKGQEARRI